jgi:RNA polymerase sigma factor (TIGR02999 family)
MQQPETTDLPQRLRSSDKEAFDQLIAAVYAPMRLLAHQRLLRAPSQHSLNTTGLVHEAYLRMIQSSSIAVQSREHFLAIASRVMRNVLVDLARSRTADRRGGGATVIELNEETWIPNVDLENVTDLDEALTRLEQLDEGQARMVEQRYFGGLSLEEVASANHVSLATVKRALRSARAWLALELSSGERS